MNKIESIGMLLLVLILFIFYCRALYKTLKGVFSNTAVLLFTVVVMVVAILATQLAITMLIELLGL